MRSRTEVGTLDIPCPVVFSGSGGTFGGGSGAGLPKRFSRIHEPRVTGDVRFGDDVTVWSFSNLYGCFGGLRKLNHEERLYKVWGHYDRLENESFGKEGSSLRKVGPRI